MVVHSQLLNLMLKRDKCNSRSIDLLENQELQGKAWSREKAQSCREAAATVVRFANTVIATTKDPIAVAPLAVLVIL